MDVTFTNVLEGARQYFQGLPTGTSSTVSPSYSSEPHLRTNNNTAYTSESHLRNGPVHSSDSHLRNTSTYPADSHLRNNNSPAYASSEAHHRNDQVNARAAMVPTSNACWPSQSTEPAREHTPVHRPASHNSDSSRPPSHSSQYVQNVAAEQNRALYTGSYQEQYQTSQQQMYQHQQPQQQQQHQQLQQHQSQHNTQQQQQQQHSQPQQQQFQFSRPHAREAPSNYPQYQSHISTASPYHPSLSPYHQVPSPQQPRAPSREQIVPRVPSREQPIPRVPSQEQLVPRVSPRDQQYPQSSDNSYQHQPRSYYQQQSTQPTTVPPSSTSYKPAVTQQQQQSQKMYYKHIYSPQQTHQSVYASSRQGEQTASGRSSAGEQGVRTTHNLPPIAAISNYHSSRSTSRDPPARPPVSSTTSRTRSFSSSLYTSSSNTVPAATSSSIIQQNPAATYQDYRYHHASQQYHQQATTTSVTTQSYSQVIVTSSSSSAGSYYGQNQYQQHTVTAQTLPRTQANNVDQHNVNGRLTRRESPLDLSVKTVRTPADSTFGDAEQDARNKYYHHNHRPSPQSISTHNYPQLDVNSFERNLTQRSGAAKLPTATAPKVEFRPNFNVPSLNQPRRPTEEPRHHVLPEKAHSNSRLMPDGKNLAYRYPTGSVPTTAHVNSYIQAASKSCHVQNDSQKKRPYDVSTSLPPNKIPKVADAWRQSIDLQIEERLSNYKQERAKLASPPGRLSLLNGTHQDKMNEACPGYQKQNYENVAQPTGGYSQYQAQTNHCQTYVPSPAAGAHHYPSYTGFHSQQQSNSYLQSISRSNSSSSLTTLTNSKSNFAGAVDKRVLSLLRNSLEVKEQKKLEQLKSNENLTQHPRSDVQHPSTDVTAPLQPKPGFVNRNNVSPFTPTNFPESGNTASMYKFHIPKAIDSVNYDTSKPNKQMLDTVITNNNMSSDYDGLAAAFIAARIRTKGELKQVASQSMSHNNKSQLQDIIEMQLKSPMKQDTMQNYCHSSSSATLSTSPPKPSKERQGALAPRKRLFSRNEEDPNNLSVPPRDKSGLRSSSETSVFDFPDSDSENDARRESLDAMRKGRKTSKQSTPVAELKEESLAGRPISPGDDVFAQLCDNFVEQLKSGAVKKKCNNSGKKKRGVEAEVLVQLESVTKEQSLSSSEVKVKVEDVDVEESQEKNKVVCVKEEPKIEQELLSETVSEVKDDSEADLKLIVSNESESKKEDPVFLSKKQSVRRRILSSSDSSDNETLSDKKEHISKSVEAKPLEQVEPSKETPPPTNNDTESPLKTIEILPVVRPSKKPSFGDGSGFYPGWEEGEFKYKKSLRMPPSLIQVARPPQFHRLSTSLPDLDPCPHSPTSSIPTDDKESSKDGKHIKIKKIKSEPLESDNESNSSFNLFGKKTNYDSEGGASVRSLPNTAKERSIIDKLLEKCGGRKRKKYKRKDDHSARVIPKAEFAVELLPTPSLEIKEEDTKETKKLSNSPVIKSESPLLQFRKSTINNFKNAFIKRSNNIVGVNEFATVVLNSRTRRETRVQKQRATIKEVFGEDRPASAPPAACVNDIQIKEEVIDDNTCLGNLVIRLEKKNDIVDKVEGDIGARGVVKDKKKDDSLFKAIIEKVIKTEVGDETAVVEDDAQSLDNVTIKSETPSIDGDDGSVSGKRRGKFGKMRRKFSSGFDYIRKKKKVKKENVDGDSGEKKKKKIVISKTLESVDDIQKEIKTWVLNKGIGETHLHRAARLGYTDVTAYCLEKMNCNPSPRDNAGYTPLHWACSKGHLQIAKLLLLYGANPSESAHGGIRPLHEAVENGYVEIARLLLSYGADPTLATYSGLTPLALTNDEVTKNFLRNHLNDIEGEPSTQWLSYGPASVLDPVDLIGFNHMDNVPDPDPEIHDDDIEIEMSESLLPNLYTLRNESPSDRWVLLQDLSNFLKIKSRDALLKQICPPSTSNSSASYRAFLRELKMSEFLEQAHCCQFLNAGEKINTRASKIALVKYTDKVKELLNVDSVLITTTR